MKEIVAQLMVWAVTNSAYTAPEHPPGIEYKPAAAFREQVCPPGKHCAARAYYEDGSAVIVLSEEYRNLGEVQQRALVVHELVHYLQDLSGKYRGEQTCDIWLEREREALRLQVMYLVHFTDRRRLRYQTPRLSRRQCEEARRRH